MTSLKFEFSRAHVIFSLRILLKKKNKKKTDSRDRGGGNFLLYELVYSWPSQTYKLLYRGVLTIPNEVWRLTVEAVVVCSVFLTVNARQLELRQAGNGRRRRSDKT